MHTFTLFITFITATYSLFVANRIVISPAYLYFPRITEWRMGYKKKNIFITLLWFHTYIYLYVYVHLYAKAIEIKIYLQLFPHLFVRIALQTTILCYFSISFITLLMFLALVAWSSRKLDWSIAMKEKKIPWKYRVLMVCVDTKPDKECVK